MSDSNVVPFGCETSDWRKHLRIQPRVARELGRDPSLGPLLKRSLDAHGRKLHRMMARDGFVHTVVWRERSSSYGCVIATHCSPDLVFQTIVARVRVMG